MQKYILASLLSLVISFPAIAATAQGISKSEYLEPNMKNISRMYWRLGKFDIEDDTAVDNYLRINECDVYKDYFLNEFEWRRARDAGRDFLKDNAQTFPLRLQFMQPLALGEYDFERKGFNVVQEHKINAIKRFELPSDDVYSEICGTSKAIFNYPRVLIVELSRPVTIDFIPMEEDKAQELIAQKMEAFKKLGKKSQTKENLHLMRDAVLSMKIKAFSMQGADSSSQHGYRMGNILAVLEGVEVHADLGRDELIYSESYRRRQSKSSYEQKLKEKYDAKKESAKKERAAQ